MTDEQSLLAAVAANVDDDTPRLVMADWYDDGGDADRAAFIRLQVRLGRLTTGDLSFIPLHERQAQLQKANWAAWLPPDHLPGFKVVTYRRGFVAVAKPLGFQSARGDLGRLTDAPTLEALSLFFLRMREDDLGRIPHLPALRRLSVSDCWGLTPRSYAPLAGWPDLRAVSVNDTALTDEAVGYLAAAAGLRTLSLARFGHGPAAVTDAGVRHLGGLADLEDLTLRGIPVTGAGLGILPGLRRLRRLALPRSVLTENAVVPLGGCPGLEDLNVDHDRPDAGGRCGSSRLRGR